MSKNVQKYDILARSTYLLPQTKQNIILTAQNNSDIDAQPKLNITSSDIRKNSKKEQLSNIEKKEEVSISNPMNLYHKTEDSQIIIDENNIQNSTSYNINNSWFY